MAAKPITFTFAAETAAYLRDVKGMAVQTEDLEDAFVAVSNSADDMERKLSKAVKDAESDVEVLERAIKDLPDATDHAADQAAKDFDRVGDEAKEAGSEAGQEFRQNLGAALGQGGSMADVVSESLGALAGSMSGPLGLVAAGVAGVAALAFNNVKKQAEDLKSFTEGMADAITSLYDQGVKTQDKLRKLDAFNDFLSEQSDLVQGLEDDFANTGVASDEYLTSLFEGGGALQAQRSELARIVQEGTTWHTNSYGTSRVLSDSAESANELLKYLESQSDEQGDIAGKMQTTQSASQKYAEDMGLADRNVDGIVDSLDLIDPGMPKTRADIEAVKATADAMKNLTIPVHIKYDATGYTGGAFQTSGGGQLRPVFANDQRSP